MIQKMTTSEETEDCGQTKGSTVNVSPDLLAMSVLSLIHHRKPPQEVINILGSLSEMGNIDASVSLTKLRVEDQFPESVQSAIKDNFEVALHNNNTTAYLLVGNVLLLQGDPKEVARGISLLRKMGESGCPDAFWILSQYFADKHDPLASVYCEKAVQAGYPPAMDASEYAREICEATVKKLEEQHESVIRSMRKRIQILLKNNDEHHTAWQAERETLSTHISHWRKSYEDLEVRLASLTSESIRHEYVVQQQVEISRLEDELLESHIALEDAEASKLNTERTAAKLTSENRRLAGRLRKNGISLNDYESSSSSDGGQP